MKKSWNVNLKKHFKKGQTTISDRSKAVLVVVCFLLFLGFYFYRNLESNLKGFYDSRNFRGDIQITGFSWTRLNAGPDVNYIYSETIEGKKVSIPLKKSVRFKHLVMPYFNKIDMAKNQGIENTYDDFDRAYLPIIEKGFEFSTERIELEAELDKKINEYSAFSGSWIEISLPPFKKRGNNYFSLMEQYENGIPNSELKILGGWYEVSYSSFIESGDIYVKIISPENMSRFKESGNDFKSVLKHYLAIKSLPDGWYGLFDDGKQVSETVEIRNGKVRG